jgi:ADP-heptose:LPS heptosyltransferase
MARAEKLRRVEKLDLPQGRERAVGRVIVLSRVTIGADAAITSVIIERMKREFPDAELALVGGGKAAELFGGDPRIRFPQVEYRRAGTAIERFNIWLDLLRVASELIEDARRGETLVVDPDSRLTQLGLLPVSSPGEYIFFPSREYGGTTNLSLAELASAWLDEVFGSEQPVLPQLSLGRDDLDISAGVRRQLNKTGERPVVAINFGVGVNPLKRAGELFERALIGSLIRDGAIIMLDKGFGEEEAERAESIVRHALAANRNARAIEADQDSLKRLLEEGRLTGADLLVIRGRIGLLAGMIGQSDLYIGYDSAGQHIAAALGVPCIDIFAGFSSPRMLDRWRPTGSSESRVIAVDTVSGPADEEMILSQTLGHAHRLLQDEDHHT